jgi:acyl-CoA thioester hydrolase
MFTVDLKVRDYECDQQGIVNNSVYLNYLQHARHEYGRTIGLDWTELSARGVNLVLRRVELDYLRSLRPGDEIRISAIPSRKGKFRFYFEQEIRILPGNDLILKALLTVACVVDGKPAAPPELDAWFGAP